MAPTRLVISLTLGEPEYIDGLCAECWCPSLWRVKAYRLTDTGVSTFGAVTVCTDCGTRA